MSFVPGIDVSHWQEEVDWTAVQSAGIRFAFIKATEGTTLVDPMFSKNWTGCRAAGILRGAYHFFRPALDARKQAELFLKTVVLEEQDFAPVLDLEVHDHLANQVLVERAETWVKLVQEATGRRPVIYTSVSFCNDHFSLHGNPPTWAKGSVLWIANYLPTGAKQPFMPRGWDRWTFWQHSDRGRLPGIRGNVDLNWFNGPLEELFAMVQAGPVPVEAEEQEGQTPEPERGVHIIQPGDDLRELSLRYKVNLRDLVKANPQLLQPGMRLHIPEVGQAADTLKDLPVRFYVIQPGDTLFAVAQRFNTSVQALVDANRIPNPNMIAVGQRIKIAG